VNEIDVVASADGSHAETQVFSGLLKVAVRQDDDRCAVGDVVQQRRVVKHFAEQL